MNENFYNHLELYRKRFPREAALLSIRELENYQIVNKSGKENLKDPEGHFVHGDDPVKEAKDLLALAIANHKNCLFIFGLGLGYIFDEALPWLEEKSERRLVIFEPSLSVIHKFFETKRAEKFLTHKQVVLYYLEEATEQQFQKWSFAWLAMSFMIVALPYWEEKELFGHFAAIVCKELYNLNGTVGEFLAKGATFFRNFYFNLPYFTSSYFGNGLFNRFKDIPAIITGAGPSLENAIPYLKEFSDKALIISGGSSFKALGSHGVFPHFGMGVDPNNPQLHRFSSPFLKEIPFIYSCRLYHPVLESLEAPLLYYAAETGYSVDRFFEKGLHIPKTRPLDGGFNVVNTAAELACRFGCNPIIFVGLDLAFTNDKIYAKGIVDDHSLKENEQDDPIIIRKDRYGKPIKTLWKWVKESEWLGDLAKKNKKTKFLNATENGLALPGIPYVSLEEIQNIHLKKTFFLPEWIHANIQSVPLNVKKENIQKLLGKLEKSLMKVLKTLETLHKEVDNKYSGIAALSEFSITKEIGFRYLLEPFNHMLTYIIQNTADKNDIYNLSQEQKEALLIEVNRDKLQFLKEVIITNLEILHQSQKEAKAPAALVDWDRFEIDIPTSLLFEDGIHEFKAKDGRLLAKVHVEKKKRVKSTLYYPTGVLYVEKKYDHEGKLVGEERFFDTNGELRTVKTN